MIMSPRIATTHVRAVLRRTPGRTRARIAAALLAPTVVACGAGGNDQLASARAEELAAGAEQLAAFLDTEAPCDAIAQAATLRDRARAGRQAGEVPDDVVLRVERVTDEVTRDLTCAPEPEAEPEPDTAAEPDAADTPDDPPVADSPPSRDEGNGNDDQGDEGNGDEGGSNQGNGNDGKGNNGNGNDGNGNDGRGNDGNNGKGNNGKGNG